MAKNKGRKREEVIASLLNYARLKMDLLAAGREDDAGTFPNAETGFVIRKWIMKGNHSSELLEIGIPRQCASELICSIDRSIELSRHPPAPARRTVPAADVDDPDRRPDIRWVKVK